ncbi:hypothetical protein MSP8887_03828 [Marinomonas spartinae]|uniref:Lipoprotein n=1 Tax=Marinomonas spartinae TaxID=1792290 RepID=A0A1A8TN79_9GAMM|nr:hypothetical protein [Marinomonas spartinae]SBS35259.1 hypothetical protein MSP8886_03325 [Marinomonas spartinae]SBS39453.1 hypothetical protein MSP8887_03828 [Marinomonas spartinae]
MLLLRAGVLILPLLLSACSTPFLKDMTHAKGEQTTKTEQKEKTTEYSTPKTATNTEIKVKTFKEQKEKLDELLTTAKKQYHELHIRAGIAPEIPQVNISTLSTANAIADAERHVIEYNKQTAAKLSTLNTLVEQRKNAPKRGDLLKIFIHKADISLPKGNFMTQPLIGQWVRGESRVIRLKDSILFDTKHSEDIKITYSERYQILVNGQVISVVKPYTDKSTAPFDVNTSEKDGKIKGELDYSVVTSSQN